MIIDFNNKIQQYVKFQWFFAISGQHFLYIYSNTFILKILVGNLNTGTCKSQYNQICVLSNKYMWK